MRITQRGCFLACSIVLTLAVAGCSHTHQFNPDPKPDALVGNPLANKRVALDLSETPETYLGSAQGHRYAISGIRNHAQLMTHRLLADSKWIDDSSKAEYVLKLVMQLDLSGAIMGTQCIVNAEWKILQAEKMVGYGKGSDKRSIPTMYAGGGNCEIAAINAMAAGLDIALGAVAQKK